MEEAIEKGHLIVVHNTQVARLLKKRFERGHFVSIGAHDGTFDGCNGLFVNVELKDEPRILEFQNSVIQSPFQHTVTHLKHLTLVNGFSELLGRFR